MTNQRLNLQIVGVLCNAACSSNGDCISLLIEGRKLWSCSDHILLHPQYYYYLDFENGTAHVNGHVDSLPAFSPEKFCIPINCLPVIIKLQVSTLFEYRKTLGRVVVQRCDLNSKIIQQRIKAEGADYGIIYRLLNGS